MLYVIASAGTACACTDCTEALLLGSARGYLDGRTVYQHQGQNCVLAADGASLRGPASFGLQACDLCGAGPGDCVTFRVVFAAPEFRGTDARNAHVVRDGEIVSTLTDAQVAALSTRSAKVPSTETARRDSEQAQAALGRWGHS